MRLSLILISLSFYFIGSAQKSEVLPFEKLKFYECEGYKSSRKKSEHCFLVEVVKDGLNYYPSQTKETEAPVQSPKEAYKQFRKLYPDIKNEELNCWTQFDGFYIFSTHCFKKGVKGCYFYCIYYIKKGEKEFRYFVPRT